MVEVAMMLLLPMAALAFAIPPKRSTSALGVFLSIVFIVTYHKINEYAESLGALGRINPVIALWVPYFLTAGLIIWMYHVSAHRPGGQPIGALERIFRSEEHTSELQSLMHTSYAVFCLRKQ